MTKKAAEVLKRLVMRGVSKFRALFAGNRSRSEIVATFLAVLELCKLKSVQLGDELTDDLSVTFVRMPDETAPDSEFE